MPVDWGMQSSVDQAFSFGAMKIVSLGGGKQIVLCLLFVGVNAARNTTRPIVVVLNSLLKVKERRIVGESLRVVVGERCAMLVPCRRRWDIPVL